MSRGKKLAAGGLLGGLVVVVALAWFLGLFSSEPEEASVEASLDAIAEESDDDAGSDNEQPEPESITDLTGTWLVEPGEATFVGYRIDEVLSGVDFTAVGRSPAVEGIVEASGTTITSVDITADLTQLASDNGARDGQLKTQALESNTFPDGIFSLTEPIELGSIPPAGETVTVIAIGELTIHGVTNPVEIELEGAAQDDRLVVVGSTSILLADYDIDAPEAPIVASVDEEAIIEFSLLLGR